MTVRKFRRKTVVLEAMQWPTITPDSDDISKTAEPFHEWIGESFSDFWQSGELKGRIKTLEGVMRVVPGDWIIKGVAGEFYPCKPDIFEATYEPVLRKDR